MRTTPRRPSRRRDRRGATMILVSLLMVPLVGIAAFSLDVGWWQVGANQLQTTADAAALAAARAKQLYPTNDTQTKAETYARQVAASNKAFAQSVTLTSADVEPVFWTPSTRTVAATNWSDANAVRVTARATPGLIFAGVVRATAPTIARSSVAWIANVNSASCVKPWSLPYDVLYDKVASLTGISSTSPAPGGGQRPDLSQEQLAALTTGSYSEAARTVVIRGPTTDADLPSGAVGLSEYDGQWKGFSHSGNVGNASYQSQIFGCDETKVSVTADQGRMLPGGANYECWTVHALMGNTGNSCSQPSWIDEIPTHEVTCHYKARRTVLVLTHHDAGCYPSAGSSSPGISRRVAWGDLYGQGSGAVDNRVVGRVRLLCVFRGLGAGTGGSSTTVETCSPGGGLLPISNLPIGTMVVTLEGLAPEALGADTELGNTVGTSQRLILVR